jgi:hypothetical protein
MRVCEPGTYNIVDDEPAAARDWLPVLAQALGAKPPRRFPEWLARMFGGRGSGRDGNRVPRCLEREGQARAGVEARIPELAARIRGRIRLIERGARAQYSSWRLTHSWVVDCG